MYDTIKKTIAAWAFNNYIAFYYFDNININQLKIAFEKGEVELQDLPVKKEALKHFKLPVEVRSGVVDKLSIRVPLLALLTDPWIIKIQNLVLVVAPAKLDSYSENKNDTETSEDPGQLDITSEENRLAEFYSSFSKTVNETLSDIKKNIRIEIESITINFENFDHGVQKLCAERLLIHRPSANRNIVVENISFHISKSVLGVPSSDVLRVNIERCNLEVQDETSENMQLLVVEPYESKINGSLVIIDTNSEFCNMPLLIFTLEDCRILHFSGQNHQTGSLFAKFNCDYFNREASSWDSLLQSWPFNLNWKSTSQNREISLTSEEVADFELSSELLQLIDCAILRMKGKSKRSKDLPQELNSMFVLRNETGYKLYFRPMKENSPIYELNEHNSSCSSGVSSSNSKDSSHTSQDSMQWITVDVGKIISFGSETIPIFQRGPSDSNIDETRSLLVRVDGWKTLLPIPVDRTGLFLRDALSDRVKNEDTYIVVTIDLEEGSARKIISIRSTFQLVNLLDDKCDSSFHDPSPKKNRKATPLNYKLTSFNHNTNFAELMSKQVICRLFPYSHHKTTTTLSLVAPGFNFTLVGASREKLVEASFETINLNWTRKSSEQILDCSIQEIRLKNALSDCERRVVLDRAQMFDNSTPALRIIVDRVLGSTGGISFFKQVQLSMCDLVLNIEEKLFLRLFEFISHRKKHAREGRLRKYYFDLLRIDLSSVKVSVFASPELSGALQMLKSQLGLQFITVEDVQIQLAPYFKMNVSNTFREILDSVKRFYKGQILHKIIGQSIQNYLWVQLSDLLSSIYDEAYNKLFN